MTQHFKILKRSGCV